MDLGLGDGKSPKQLPAVPLEKKSTMRTWTEININFILKEARWEDPNSTPNQT